MLSLRILINNLTKKKMDNLLDIENRKVSKKKLYFQLVLLIGILVTSIDDIFEKRYQNFIIYYLIVFTILCFITLVSYLINFKNRNYFVYFVSLLTLLWFISFPFKYNQYHGSSGFMFYLEITICSAGFVGLIYKLVNYKKFINEKPFIE